MKKLLTIILSITIILTSLTVNAVAHETPLSNNPLYTIVGLLHHNAHFKYNDEIVLWGKEESKDEKGDTNVKIYFGTSAEKSRKSKNNFIVLKFYGDKYNEKLDYAYIALLNIADDPNKEERLHKGHISFSLLCHTIGMEPMERYELWDQLSNYDPSTDRNFSKKGKVFYQHCPSINGDVFLAFDTVEDKTGLLFILGRATD